MRYDESTIESAASPPIRECVSGEFSRRERISWMWYEFMGSATKGGLTMECGKGRNEGRCYEGDSADRSIGRSVGRSVGRSHRPCFR